METPATSRDVREDAGIHVRTHHAPREEPGEPQTFVQSNHGYDDKGGTMSDKHAPVHVLQLPQLVQRSDIAGG